MKQENGRVRYMWLGFMASPNTNARPDGRTSFVLVMVSAMMLAAPGSSVTGMKGREEVPEAEGVIADEGVTASSDEGTCSHTKTHGTAMFTIYFVLNCLFTLTKYITLH